MVLAATLAGLVLFVAALRYSPPDALPDTAPADRFSGVRAHATLTRVLGDGAPHPVGSDASAAVRARIMKELVTVGLEPVQRRGLACRGWSCAYVWNVVAEVKGASTDAILLSAHYDSVAAGPGAGDDGSGVAVLLEVARALRSAPPLSRSVRLLFDEGEEAGLLGALAFAAGPDAEGVRAVVNVDARGNGGPAILFETSHENDAVVRVVAAKVPRPFTSSALFTAYASMPNSTDFSVWKDRAGAPQGVNFALLGDLASYHTPLDRLDNVDRSSLQHEGDGALAMARGLAEADIDTHGRLIWFDVIGVWVVCWPEAWAPRIAWGALVLVVLAMAGRIARRRVTPLDLVRGLGVLPFAALGAMALAVTSTSTLMSSGVLPAPWTANAPYAMAAMWTIGVAMAGAATAATTRDLGEGAWCGVWLTLAIAGVVLAVDLPTVSHLLTVPAALAGALGLVTTRAKREDVGDGALLLASLIPALALVTLAAPLLLLLYTGFGISAAPNAAILGAVLAAAFAPVFALAAPQTRWIAPGILAIGALALTAAAAGSPAFTEAFPSRANVVFAEDAAGARAMVDTTWGAHTWGAVPHAMRTALGMAHESPRAPWAPQLVLATDLPRADLAPPVVEALASADEGAERRVSLRLRSARGARDLTLLLPPGASARFVRLEGAAISAASDTSRWRELRVAGVPPEGVVVEILAAREPITVTVTDETSGLPPSAAPIATARPKTAVPAQRGDLTIVSRDAPL